MIKLDETEPLKLLKILCRSRYEAVRLAGVYGLSKYTCSDGVIDLLVRMLEVDPSEDVKAASATVLTLMDRNESIPDDEPTRPRIRTVLK